MIGAAVMGHELSRRSQSRRDRCSPDSCRSFAAKSSCRREAWNGSYVVIPSASCVLSRALSAALVPLGGVAVLFGCSSGVLMWLTRNSFTLTSSRSRHSAHLIQASESACQPDWPSRSDARPDASLQACARFRQSDTLIIVVTPLNALSHKSYGQWLGVQSFAAPNCEFIPRQNFRRLSFRRRVRSPVGCVRVRYRGQSCCASQRPARQLLTHNGHPRDVISSASATRCRIWRISV
jgi:hypothetical protein